LTKYSFFRGLKNYAYSNLKSSQIMINDYNMILDSHDSFNLSLKNSYEPIETELIKQKIKNDDVVIDVGSNIGYYTLLFASKIGPQGHVFSFEPAPENSKILKSNVALNNFQNVTVEEFAVSNKSGKVDLYLADEGIGQHRIHESRFGKSSISVKMISIDEYLSEKSQKIDFVKIDVEGAEYDVLKGMENILNVNPSIELLLEFNPINLIEHGSDPKEFLDFLKQKNFKLFQINKITNQFEIITLIDELLSLDHSENIFCTRNDF